MQDGDLRLGEGAAILQHLCETRQIKTDLGGDLGVVEWYPSEPAPRALTNMWLHAHHTNSRKCTLSAIVALITEGPDAADEKAEQVLRPVAQMLETHFLSTDAAFLTGRKPTIADLMAITEWDQLTAAAFGLFDFTAYPKLVRA